MTKKPKRPKKKQKREKPKMLLTKFELKRLAVFKIMQCKANKFSLTLMLPFCHYFDRKLAFGKLACIFTGKAVNLQSDPLLCFENSTAENLIESYKHKVAF